MTELRHHGRAGELRRTSVLCADDFAMSDGISDAIAELAGLQRLSAASALVTGPLWRSHGRRVESLRKDIAVGLHVSLTWGEPLGHMPDLAPGGRFPRLARLVAKALAGAVDEEEVAGEVERQTRAFRAAAGVLPDFIDGHEHVHALPCIRNGLISGLRRVDPSRAWIIRDPSDLLSAIIARGVAVPKALAVSALACGFARRCAAAGLRTNTSFAGLSAFSAASRASDELPRFFLRARERHLVICHPGRPEKQETRDAIAGRRTEEREALIEAHWLNDLIWHPARAGAPLWG